MEVWTVGYMTIESYNQEKIIEWLFYVDTLMMFHFDQIRGSKKLGVIKLYFQILPQLFQVYHMTKVPQ